MIWGGYSDGFIRSWNCKDYTLIYERGGHSGSVRYLECNNDILWTWADCNKLLERDYTGRLLREFNINNQWIRGLQLINTTFNININNNNSKIIKTKKNQELWILQIIYQQIILILN